MKYRALIRYYILLALISIALCSGCGDHSKERSNQSNSSNEGFQLFTSYGCAVCHSMEGEVLYGPSLNEIWKQRIKVSREGIVLNLIADRTYLTRSISDPGYEKVVGFESKDMPKTYLTRGETKSIVDYIVTVNKQKDK
jgi:hypothetical protein